MPRGRWTPKDERQYEHIKDAQREDGVPEDRAEEIAARTVNKQRRLDGRTENRRTQGTGNPNSPLMEHTGDELTNPGEGTGHSGPLGDAQGRPGPRDRIQARTLMDLPTFILAERIIGTISPVDGNPTEPERPGTLHYLATMDRDGRSFATHVSAPVGEVADVGLALRIAGGRARRLDGSPTRDEWMRLAGIVNGSDDPLEVGAAYVGEAELWHRAQQAEAQALRTFLGEVAYRRLFEVLDPVASIPSRPRHAASSRPRISAAARGPWWLGALAGAAVLAVPVVIARGMSRPRRRGARAAFRRLIPGR